MDQKLLTPIGKKKIEAEIIELKKKRIEVANKIKDAKELGDLSENAEYHAAKEEQGFIEARLNEIESLLKTATVVKPSISKLKVTMSSKVRVQSGSHQIMEYEIVGMNEADPAQGKISANSPLGAAILGAKKNDILNITVPAGKIKLKILEIK